MDFILWLSAVILVIAGAAALLRNRVGMGVVFIVVGLLVGPGGVGLL